MLAEGENGEVIQTPATANKPKGSKVSPKEEYNDKSHLEVKEKDRDQLKYRKSCQPRKRDDTYMFRSHMSTTLSRRFEPQIKIARGNLSTDPLITEYQVSETAETKEIRMDVLLPQTDTPTIPKKIPAMVVPPEILYRWCWHDGNLVTFDEASWVHKIQQLWSLLDEIGWQRDEPVIIDCDGKVATMSAKGNKSHLYNLHTENNPYPSHAQGRNLAAQRSPRRWKLLNQNGYHRDEAADINSNNWRVKTNLWPNHFHSREIAKNRKEPHFVQQECSCEIA